MSIVRMIYLTTEPVHVGKVEEVWRTKCMPLMLGQPGCVAVNLLQQDDAPGTLIAYSLWDNQADLDYYLKHDAYQEIAELNRSASTSRAAAQQYGVLF